MPINRQGAFLCAGAGRCVLWIAGYGLAARNLCEEFAPRDGAAWVREEGGANRTLKKPGGPGLAARNLCEEFAPQNGTARVSGEGGANRALEKPAGIGRRRGICVKNLLPGTELQGFAGRGEQTAPWKSRPAPACGAEFV